MKTLLASLAAAVALGCGSPGPTAPPVRGPETPPAAPAGDVPSLPIPTTPQAPDPAPGTCGTPVGRVADAGPDAGGAPATVDCRGAPPPRTAGATVERLDCAAECDGLLPDAIPALRSFEVGAPSCVGGLSDGTGAVALGAWTANGYVQWRVVRADGTAAGTFRGTLPLLSQPRGWHDLVTSPGPEGGPLADLRVIAPDGTVARSEPAPGPSAVATDVRWRLAADPRGGSAVLVRSRSSLTGSENLLLLRFDASGAPLLAPDGARSADVAHTSGDHPRLGDDMAVGVSTQGESLDLVPEFPPGTQPCWDHAAFVTTWRDGHLQQAIAPVGFEQTTATGHEPLELAPLLDGDLALRVDGAWSRRFEHLKIPMAPLPAWLAARPRASFRFARGSRAYAVLPPPGEASATCEQRVEIVAPSGRLCGRVVLHDGGGAPCVTGVVDVGWDGTVVQQLRSGGCAFRWWPGLLGAP